MPVCSNCNAEQPSSEVTSCILCGYPVVREDDVEEARSDDESLDFVVSEATGDSREFVGGQNPGANKSDDDLGIESTTDLMQQEADREKSDTTTDFSATPERNQPIGDSTPPPPPTADYQSAPPTVEPSPAPEPTEPVENNAPGSAVKKLSDDEVKKIEQNLYGQNSHLRDQEKNELAEKIRALQEGNSAEPIDPAVSEKTVKQKSPATPKAAKTPKMAKKGTGIAYYYKNFIQVTGHQSLITNDLISINGREYILKPKSIKTGYIIGGAAVVFALFLIAVASVFSPSVDSGHGQLVGVVLDDYDQPYLQGASIRIPELDKTVESDQRGFFEAGILPTGTYDVEYVVDDQVVRVEQASIIGNEIRMLFLRPQAEEEYSEEQATAQPAAEETYAVADTPPAPEPKAVDKPKPKATTKKSTSTSSSKSKKSLYGKVTLDANVQNARFEIDGSVLGAGNLTYSKIKSGRHRYRVSADGYQAVEGKFTLTGGDNHKLQVTLRPLEQEQKAETFKTDDFFYSGKNAIDVGDYQTAVADLSQVIAAQPDHGDAHYHRANAYSRLKDNQKAYDDYIRAAEIYQFKRSYGKATTCYDRAISLDDKNVFAYIGRGNLYLAKGEELAAIADFDQARKLDKRNYQAYYGLGEARFKQQQYKKAVKHFKDARSINKHDPLVHQYLMLSYMALAEYKDVKKSFDKFADVATDEQMANFKQDQKFSAVIRVLESQ